MSGNPGTGLPRVRTLVVDDDFRVARLHAAHTARTEGFEVVGEAHSAGQALDAVDRLRPDLVLMDVYLPDGDGLAVLRALMERPEPPDSIVVTAVRDLHTVRTAMQLGAVHYLIKPFGSAALQDRLTSYRMLRQRMAACAEEAEQSDVDALFGLRSAAAATGGRPERTTGGRQPLTQDVVREAVLSAPRATSAVEVARQVGISRATAQRYLSRLVQSGEVRLHLRYGTSGRPQHRYSAAV